MLTSEQYSQDFTVEIQQYADKEDLMMCHAADIMYQNYVDAYYQEPELIEGADCSSMV